MIQARKFLRSWRGWIALAVVFGVTARLLFLATPAFEIDGIMYSVSWSRMSLRFLLFGLLMGHTHPPLQFLVSWIASAALGESEWALALPSVVFGSCALVMTWIWAAGTGRRIYGLAAVGLMAFNLYHVYWSQHPRMYSLLMFCSIGLLWAAETLSSRSCRWRMAAFSLFLFGTLGTHYFGVVPAAVACSLALCKLCAAFRREPPRISIEFAVRLFYAILIPVVLLLPWYGQFLAGLIHGGEAFEGVRPDSPPVPVNLAVIRTVLGAYGFGTTWLLYLFLALVAAGAWRLAARRRWGLLAFEGAWLVVPYAVFSLVPTSHFFDPSYTSSTAPVLWLWAGGGIAMLAGAASRAWPAIRSPAGITAAGLLLSLAVYAYPLRLYYQMEGRPTALKAILARIEAECPEGQVLVFEDPFDLRYYPGFYVPKKKIFFVDLSSAGVKRRQSELLAFFQSRPDAWLIQGSKAIEPVSWADPHFARKIVFNNPSHEKLFAMGLFPRPAIGPDPWILRMDFRKDANAP